MSIREQLEQHRTAVVLGFVAAITISAGIIFYTVRAGSPRQPHEPLGYFYDQHTKTLFVARDQLGPIETESGPYQGEPAGVRAHVFACGRCADEANRFIGWLSKPATTNTSALPTDRELIRRPQDERWVVSDSPPGEAIIREVNQRCKRGAPLHYCHPEPDRSP